VSDVPVGVTVEGVRANGGEPGLPELVERAGGAACIDWEGCL
jgi:hypothetical protein